MNDQQGRNILRRIPVARRLFIGFVILLLTVLITVFIIAFNGLQTLQAAGELLNTQVEQTASLQQAEAAMWEMMRAEAAVLADPGDGTAVNTYTIARDRLRALLNSDAVDPDLQTALDALLAVTDRNTTNAAQVNPVPALQNSTAQAVELAELLQAQLAAQAELTNVTPADIIEVALSRRRLLLPLLGGLGLLISGVLAFAVGRSIVQPVTELVKMSDRFAAGDFSTAAAPAPDEVGHLAEAFNRMGAELQSSFNQLQSQTQALRISADVSRQLTTILELDQLVAAVVEQIRNAFGYYHVHIYLLSDNGEILRMAGGTGAAGQEMLAANHQLRLEQGLVGRAAQTMTAVLISDVAEEPDWLPNPLLPHTRSELAVPLVWRGQLLGVLDVQQNLVNGLTEADQEVLQSLANQIAVAVQNARSYAQTEQQAERELRINTISQKIQQARTIDMVLQTALAELGETLPVKQATVKIARPKKWADGGLIDTERGA